MEDECPNIRNELILLWIWENIINKQQLKKIDDN